jgi:hypothetical protein
MILSKGEKVFVVTRRLFNGDLRRHFVGVVQEVSETAFRVKGYAFIFDEMSSQFIRHDELRTRVMTFVDAGMVINILPDEVNIEEIHYRTNEKNHRVITDDKLFTMNVSEFAINR